MTEDWDPNGDRACDLAHRYAQRLAEMSGGDVGRRACENCGTTGGYIVEIWTDDGTRPLLCEDCAEEVRRLEQLADALAMIPGCEERHRIVERAETTAGLVNRLRGHDLLPCGACAELRRKMTIASEGAPAVPKSDSGMVA